MSHPGTGQGRRILVTGAASGIGAATCRAMAAPGTALLIHTRRNAEGAEAVRRAAVEAGAEAWVVLADLAEDGTAGTLAEAARRHLGGLDVVVSNAGFADRTPFAALDHESYARSVATIQTGFLRLAQACLPLMAQARDGRIVAVSSFVAHTFRRDITLFPASAAAKAGMEALVRALAVEVAPRGLTVNAVAPGFIRKDARAHAALDEAQRDRQLRSIPLERLGEPAEVAAAIAFLASPAAGYITGQVLHVNGGVHIGG
ncbi:SDR family NAD(P)-dependent oxidoreductase [Roseomonas elaeocarpi]|uniref:SDR family NAD(P)-dependent oxidoreductase n=1 Tax=Roseomonas elaeocarpi TaxID=907779 RepID=A0ABV6JV42_9PROT